MNLKFRVFWAVMNHFETRLMLLSQKVRLQRTQKGNLAKEYGWEKKKKMATELVYTNHFFFLRNEFWYTDIEVFLFAGYLEFEFWIEVNEYY